MGEKFSSLAGPRPVPYNDKRLTSSPGMGFEDRYYPHRTLSRRKLAPTVTTPTIWPETQFDTGNRGLFTIIPLGFATLCSNLGL
jgi:hypothetical protein